MSETICWNSRIHNLKVRTTYAQGQFYKQMSLNNKNGKDRKREKGQGERKAKKEGKEGNKRKNNLLDSF